MSDSLSKEKRSWNMSRIHGTDTSIEVKVRKYLFSKGFRFRKNVKDLPGKPDIVLPKYKTVIFVHGCFWHRHPSCKDTTTPKTRVDFWEAKFAKNVTNDTKHMQGLSDMGWKVIVLWECEINKQFEATMEDVVDQLQQRIKARWFFFQTNTLAAEDLRSAERKKPRQDQTAVAFVFLYSFERSRKSRCAMGFTS